MRQINDERLKRDGAALIRCEGTFMAAPSRTSFEPAYAARLAPAASRTEDAQALCGPGS